MGKPDRTEVIERLNRILKPPPARSSMGRRIRTRIASVLEGRRRLVAARAAR